MKRFGLILCVLALMCQFLAVPVLAAPTNGASTDHVPDLNAAAKFDGSEEDYNDYVADQKSDAIADKAITIDATKYVVKSDNVVVEKDHLLWDATKDSYATWQVKVPADGWYTVSFTYAGLADSGSDIELSFMLNGTLPYPEADRFVLPRMWVDDGEIRESNGNQFAPEQKQDCSKQTRPLRDVDGFITEDLRVFLKKGTSDLSLVSYGEAFELYEIILGVPVTVPTLEEKLAQWKEEGVKDYTGEELVIQTEGYQADASKPDLKQYYDIKCKNDRSVIGKSDNSNPGVSPSDPYKQKVNYIGGSNWSMPDEYITWWVEAPEAGIYKVGFHYRQNYLVNATSYRSLKINGEHQYAEMASLTFDYENGWRFSDTVLQGRELLVYLDKGYNELSMAVTLGDLSSFSSEMENLVLTLGNMYLDIVSIVGETPDANRDYELFKRIPDLEERMEALCGSNEERDNGEIDRLIAERTDEDGNIDDIAALLQKMDIVVEKMVEYQYEAQIYKSTFYDSYAGLSAQLQEMKNMALDIDCMVLAGRNNEFVHTTSSFFEDLAFEAKRFVASFMLDYNNTASSEGKENLTIWVNWSRDQTLVLNSLITSKFTPQYDIGVTVRMTNASLLQGIMSGNGPDCSLSDSRTTPINLAMRGALVDLKKEFSAENYDGDLTYEEVMSWFVEGSEKPYIYNDGVYALPATQQFYMMFYRTDIFEKYGIVDENGVAKPPKTWDEFLEIASIFMLHNMQVGLPYTELKDIGQVNGGVASLNIFPTLLMQHKDEEGNDLSVYNKDMTGTSFAEVDTMRVFEEWTDYYTKYNLPKEYSFFNRFRVGQVPMAIQAYGQYSALAAAAPEIKGKWAMAEIPGVMLEDGTIDNRQAGFGSACMILELSEHKEAAWQLLAWWMSEETQYSYALDIESILGVAGRYSSANVEATLKLDWGSSDRGTLRAQWNKVDEIHEVPGGYYVSRAIDQAFWNVLSMNANPKDMMKKWGEVADVEIATKIEQYKDDVEGGAN